MALIVHGIVKVRFYRVENSLGILYTLLRILQHCVVGQDGALSRVVKVMFCFVT